MYWRDTFEWDFASLETVSRVAEYARNAYEEGAMAVGIALGLDPGKPSWAIPSRAGSP
jgi:hypothetical protein